MEQDVNTLKTYPLAQLFAWREPRFQAKEAQTGERAIIRRELLATTSMEELIDYSSIL